MIITSTIPKPYLLNNLRCFSAVSSHLTNASVRTQLRGQSGLRACLNPGKLPPGPRYFSCSRPNHTNHDDSQMPQRRGRSLPALMDFPEITWPSVLKTIKNFVFVHLIIRPYFDRDFALQDFIDGSKQALSVSKLFFMPMFSSDVQIPDNFK